MMNKVKVRTPRSIVGADYSAQEPRALASFSNDSEMLKAYDEDKDLYAVIGQKCFHNDYWDNLEFNKEGVLQPEGKERRSKAKSVLLGTNYGMGAKTLADRMDLTEEDAQNIINDYYEGFKGVKKFRDDSEQMLSTLGYVTDMWGRKRRIPNAVLPDFTIINKNEEFNPLLGTSGIVYDKEIKDKINKYLDLINKAKYWKDKQSIIARAKKDNLEIVDNKGAKSRAMRQCLNARIQGTAASMTKSAMIKIDNDEKLNALGFHLLITVHDEVFGECPSINAEEAAKRLSELMVEAAKEKCACKFKCDAYIVKRWYEDELSAEIKKDYKKANESMDFVKEKYSAVNPEYVEQMALGTYEINIHDDF